MNSLKLIAAGVGDVSEIRSLAKKIWNQHYPQIISQQQIDYMLDLMYSQKSLEDQITLKKHLFFLIEYNQGRIGFISVNKEKENEWSLNKFYIDQDKAGNGVGTESLNKLKEKINPEKITLTVNRQNFKSINFYFKNGFVIERVADFDIGNGYVMNDFVMTWKKK
jgi:diamine N-acetyltransferase